MGWYFRVISYFPGDLTLTRETAHFVRRLVAVTDHSFGALVALLFSPPWVAGPSRSPRLVSRAG
jgi:hypothetical protein